jgi:SAM-dependent methyltransferase
MTDIELDCWARWLLDRRDAGSEDERRATLSRLAPIRERILAHSAIQPGQVVLDVGCGDGFLAFAALPHVGPGGRVIFSDVSRDLLEHCQVLCEKNGFSDRVEFILADATNLSVVPDRSVDAVMLRSVLLYVPEKQQAFHEFHRVLKPGGRLALFEPINRFGHAHCMYELDGVGDLDERVRAAWGQPALTPMIDFDERDLFDQAQRAGFSEIHLEYRADVERTVPMDWDVYIRRAPNPLSPSLEELVRSVLTPEETSRYFTALRPRVESGAGTVRHAGAHLWATRA